MFVFVCVWGGGGRWLLFVCSSCAVLCMCASVPSVLTLLLVLGAVASLPHPAPSSRTPRWRCMACLYPTAASLRWWTRTATACCPLGSTCSSSHSCPVRWSIIGTVSLLIVLLLVLLSLLSLSSLPVVVVVVAAAVPERLRSLPPPSWAPIPSETGVCSF
jgi:hypothetical protein